YQERRASAGQTLQQSQKNQSRASLYSSDSFVNPIQTSCAEGFNYRHDFRFNHVSAPAPGRSSRHAPPDTTLPELRRSARIGLPPSTARAASERNQRTRRPVVSVGNDK